MAYHPLLDWRLALDMARLALDANAPIDFSPPYWAAFASRAVSAYFRGLQLTPTTLGGLPAGTDIARGRATIVTHPLWDHSAGNRRPDVAAALVAAQQAGLDPTLRSIFHVVRFPYE
jgi:hypothetical protein